MITMMITLLTLHQKQQGQFRPYSLLTLPSLFNRLIQNSILHSFEEEDVNPLEDSLKETGELVPIDAIGQVKPIQLSELEDELNAWLKQRFGNRQAQI